MRNNMRILKFGGSSVANAERMEQVVSILKGYHQKGISFSVVFSAMGGVTDMLIGMYEKAIQGVNNWHNDLAIFRKRHEDAAKSLLKDEKRLENYLVSFDKNVARLSRTLNRSTGSHDANKELLDLIMSFGESNSAFLIAEYAQEVGLPTSYCDARHLIITDDRFGNARVHKEISYHNIRRHFSTHSEIQVVTGFIASTDGMKTTTLGRGGSDYTAALLGAALDADIIEIWTDVNGVLTADPRKITSARTIPKMTYEEAMEMSNFGAKVIYPPTIHPAFEKNIPLLIKNTWNPENEGTIISAIGGESGEAVKGLSSIDDISLVSLSGPGIMGSPFVSAKMFNAIAKSQINIVLISQGSSEHEITLALRKNDGPIVLELLQELFQEEINNDEINNPELQEEMSVIAVVGQYMRYRQSVLGKVLNCLGQKNIDVDAIAQGFSKLNLSIVIKKAKLIESLKYLHQRFFSSTIRKVHLYMAGIGTVGDTFLNQILLRHDEMKELYNLDIQICGIAGQDKMLLSRDGIDLTHWKEMQDTQGLKTDMDEFINTAVKHNLNDRVFVDVSGDQNISNWYHTAIKGGCSVASPHKIAYSFARDIEGSVLDYAKDNGRESLFESAVGAGLPIVSTLQNIQKSGDRINRIEGILSGGISNIFTLLSDGFSLSSAIQMAEDSGYFENDASTELSGSPFVRKLLILSDIAGFDHTIDTIEVQDIVPGLKDRKLNAGQLVTLIDEGILSHNLPERESIGSDKLSMIGVIDNEKARLEIRRVSKNHAFYYLQGNDNIIAIYTDKYNSKPLIIQGPGVGTEVSAGGLMADIISGFK